MIRQETILNVTDNSGPKKALCIRVLGGTRKGYATLGDEIIVTIKSAEPKGKGSVGKKEVCRGVVVRTKQRKKREDGSYISFSDNAIVLVTDKKELRGTRVFGPVAKEVRASYPKIVSRAPESL